MLMMTLDAIEFVHLLAALYQFDKERSPQFPPMFLEYDGEQLWKNVWHGLTCF